MATSAKPGVYRARCLADVVAHAPYTTSARRFHDARHAVLAVQKSGVPRTWMLRRASGRLVKESARAGAHRRRRFGGERVRRRSAADGVAVVRPMPLSTPQAFAKDRCSCGSGMTGCVVTRRRIRTRRIMSSRNGPHASASRDPRISTGSRTRRTEGVLRLHGSIWKSMHGSDAGARAARRARPLPSDALRHAAGRGRHARPVVVLFGNR